MLSFFKNKKHFIFFSLFQIIYFFGSKGEKIEISQNQGFFFWCVTPYGFRKQLNSWERETEFLFISCRLINFRKYDLGAKFLKLFDKLIWIPNLFHWDFFEWKLRQIIIKHDLFRMTWSGLAMKEISMDLYFLDFCIVKISNEKKFSIKFLDGTGPKIPSNNPPYSSWVLPKI